MVDEDTAYLVSRLRRVVELLNAGEVHTAIAKLNADISALSGPERMEITIECAPRCLWHSNCDAGEIKNNGVMRVLDRDYEAQKSLLECLKCGRKGYVDHGTAFDIPFWVDVVDGPVGQKEAPGDA